MSGILSASLMCADLLNLDYEIEKLSQLNVEYLHIDFMDNKFVPNKAFDIGIIRNLKNKIKNMKRDIHIMAYEPQQYFDAMEIGKNDLVSVHYEACENVHFTLSEIRKRGALPSIAINPDTPVETIKDFLDEVYAVLIMMVYPGFIGQPLAPNSMERLAQLKDIIDESNKSIKIIVDGHVSWDLCQKMRCLGGDIFIGGSSSIYRKGLDFRESVLRFNELIK